MKFIVRTEAFPAPVFNIGYTYCNLSEHGKFPTLVVVLKLEYTNAYKLNINVRYVEVVLATQSQTMLSCHNCIVLGFLACRNEDCLAYQKSLKIF